MEEIRKLSDEEKNLIFKFRLFNKEEKEKVFIYLSEGQKKHK